MIITNITVLSIVFSILLPHLHQTEGVKYRAYNERGTPTVCSGHTGRDVKVGKMYSREQCDRLLKADVAKAMDGVLVSNPELVSEPNQLAAATSLTYNIGIGGYQKSGMSYEFSQGNPLAACSDLFKYTYINHKHNQGLFRRRKQEYIICTSGVTDDSNT